MKPQTVGRVLGVGLRVAGRMASQRLGGSSSAAPPVTVAGVGGPGTNQAAASQAVAHQAAGRQAAASHAAARQAGVKARAVSGGVARGAGAFLRPFRRVGGILFLEITGAFFLIFVLVFGTWAWKLRASYVEGPDHSRFLVYAVMTLVFLYLGVSSFWRARRK